MKQAKMPITQINYSFPSSFYLPKPAYTDKNSDAGPVSRIKPINNKSQSPMSRSILSEIAIVSSIRQLETINLAKIKSENFSSDPS